MSSGRSLRVVVAVLSVGSLVLGLVTLTAAASSRASSGVVTSGILPAQAITLGTGASQYFYVGSTAGGQPMNSVSWTQDLGVVASYSGNLSISVGRSTLDQGSYDSAAGNYAIAGAGVTGYEVLREYSAQTTASGSGGTSLSVTFPADTGDLVLLMVGGEGDGSLALSGFTATTLQDATYSEAGSNVIASAAIFSASLATGTYTADISSVTYPTNAGTSLGAVAYVLVPGPACTQSTPGSQTQLPLESGLAQPNLWNTLSANGHVTQCYSGAALTTKIALQQIVYIKQGPAAYAEAAYGLNLDDQPFCLETQPGCQVAPFSIPLSTFDLERFRALVSYSIGTPNPTTLPTDFAFDFWLEHDPAAAGNGCPNTCAGPAKGDIEVLIHLYNSGLIHCTSTPFLFSTMVTLGGLRQPTTWSVCTERGGTKATLVAIALQVPAPALSGSIGLPLTTFLNEAVSTVGVHPTSYYNLMGVELGSEFGSGPPTTAQAVWQWTLERLQLSNTSSAVAIVP